MEEWVPIKGFPNYSVSDAGNVRQDNFDRLIHPRANQYGGVYVGLMSHGVQYCRSLPLIVAEAFLPQGLANFDTPINLNGDRFDCRVENLMWRPRAYARKYNHQFKEPYFDHIPDPVRVKHTRKKYANSFEAACRFGLLESEVIKSIVYVTYAWPTYQLFELA